ncbi:GSCFA domain-containing protein [Brevundimonas sp. NPDC003935]|uniref:GSCFA domain-containing protein n=1 Tax=unclassified Brevundimonas TaxID=2622653 RepID=UPI0036B35D64
MANGGDNPYRAQPDHAFWSRAVGHVAAEDVDPVVAPRFALGRDDQIVTAGSCFAQHISRSLQSQGYRYLVTEPGPTDRNYGVYPARFGNIYTARQLLQLFQRAFGLFAPAEPAWRLGERFVDPFRPQIEPEGFDSDEAMLADREQHLAAVRTMFEQADVLVFTLGLTEGWVSQEDGAVFPLAPGVAGDAARPGLIQPHHFTVQEIVDDLNALLKLARILTPDLRVLFTVSPVALMATISDRHVLAATTYSKSVLRVAAETVARQNEGVDYFPSYEIITGPQSRGRYFAEDLRNVLPEGVAQVMKVFGRHYLGETAETLSQRRPAPRASMTAVSDEDVTLQGVICDEEAIDRP